MLSRTCRPSFLLNVIRQNKPSVGAARFSTSSVRREVYTIQDTDDFKEKVIDNPDPVVIDFKVRICSGMPSIMHYVMNGVCTNLMRKISFQAQWCGPCKLLTPRLEAAIAATEGQVHLALVDIDDLGDLALDFGVNAVPTVVGMKDGKPVDKFVGLLDEDMLGAFIDNVKNA